MSTAPTVSTPPASGAPSTNPSASGTPPTSPAPTVSTPPIGDFETVQFAGYEWLVLEKDEDGSQLVISKDIIDMRAYNDTYEDTTWEESDLRAYLNGEWFWDKLSPADQARVQTMHVVNNDNPWYGTEGGNDTEDKVFLLSLEELVKYFGDSGALANRGENDWYFYDDYSQNCIAYVNMTEEAQAAWEQKYGYNAGHLENNGYSGDFWWWWLRSPGYYSDHAAHVRDGGRVGVGGSRVDDALFGLRPVLRLSSI